MLHLNIVVIFLSALYHHSTHGAVDWQVRTAEVVAVSANDCITFIEKCELECSPGLYYVQKCMMGYTKAKGKYIIEAGSLCKCVEAGGLAAPDPEVESWLTSIYDKHNHYRALHGVDPLTPDTAIASVAQAWANYLAQNNKFEHSSPDDHDYGENLYAGSGNTLNVDQPTDLWYNEISEYDFNNPGFSAATGHFTQLVWKTSTKVGCGVASSDTWPGVSKMWIVCCNYSPYGNSGDYAGNVPNLV